MAKYIGCILTRQFIAVTILRVVFVFVSERVSRSDVSAAIFQTNSSLAETSWLSTFSLIQKAPLSQHARENQMVLMKVAGGGCNLGDEGTCAPQNTL